METKVNYFLMVKACQINETWQTKNKQVSRRTTTRRVREIICLELVLCIVRGYWLGTSMRVFNDDRSCKLEY